MSDRKDRPLEERVEAREFDDPKVQQLLDALSVESIEYRLGPPRVVTVHATAPGWDQGSGQPSLASEDPAVMQAIGRCLASRSRFETPQLSAGAIHPRRCGWCDYPTEQLQAASSWAVWHSRYVISELLVWTNDERHVSYVREVRSGEYGNPAWTEFFGLSRRERASRVERAMALEAAA